MKNILNITVAVIASGLLTVSCDDLLETKNYTDMASTNFFQSEDDIDAAVVGLYVPCTTNWGYTDGGTGDWYNAIFNADINAYYAASLVSTDIACAYSTNAFDNFTIGPSSGGALTNTYNVIRFVARATDVINRIENCDGATEEVRARYIAETKTLRAWYMYVLLVWFGPTNVKLDPETLMSNEIEPRPDEDTYVGYIETDLTDAIKEDAFPDNYNDDADNWGRTSRGVAYGIRMRLYMHQKEWAKAKADAEQLMNMGYALIDSYEDVFNTSQTSEHIWSIPSNTASDNYYVAEVIPADFVRGYNHLGKEYMRGTESEYMAGWQVYCMRWDFYDTFEDNDVRKATILCEYEASDGTTKTRSGMTGPIPIKYTDSQYYDWGIQKEFTAIRYAEVLLSYAEADNELNGPTSGAISAVKQVTDRAGIEIPSTATASQDAFREFLMEERGRELYCEGQRRTDLIRQDLYISRAVERGNDAQDYHVLYPIPQTVITEAGGIVEQNPGYTE